MTTVLAYALQISGMVFLYLGYRKSNRNLMLAGAVLLWFGGGFDDFLVGVREGYTWALSA
jgi:hypothetical protein